jgi:phage terminase large subunit
VIEINNKYSPIADSDGRYFIVTGGRGSGKSFSVNLLLVLLTYEAGHTILFTRYTLSSTYISIIPEFLEKIELLDKYDDFYITKDEIRNKRSGSKIIFKGIKTSSGDQTANLKSLQGVTTFVLDEAEELTNEDTFDKIDLSVRQLGKHNRVILILNPTTKEHWIYKRFFEDKGIQEGINLTKDNVTYIHTTYLDNIENLSDSYINQVESIKQHRPEKYKHQILGGWLNKAEGVIFTNWSIGKFKKVGVSVFGQDYGFSNDPSTLVETNIDTANKIIYLKECFYLPKLTTSEIARLNMKHAIDNLIVGDSAEVRLLSELKSKGGCNVVASIKGAGSIIYGISLLQDYDLIVDEQSINLIKELNNYSWLEKKSNTPIDKHNHLIDAIRYAVSYQLQNPNKGKYYIQ